MKYQLYTSSKCHPNCNGGYEVGKPVVGHVFEDVNKAYKRLESYNAPNRSDCNCRFELKEIEE